MSASTEFFVFASKNKQNIHIGCSHGLWAVSDVVEATLSARFTKATNNITIGAWGLFYCSENHSFTVPFRIKSLPLMEYIEGVWPERWALPFKIEPRSTPNLWLGIGKARRIWSSRMTYDIPSNSINGITGLTVFLPNYVNSDLWNLTLEALGADCINDRATPNN